MRSAGGQDRANYGIDAPLIVSSLAAIGVAAILLLWLYPPIGRYSAISGTFMLVSAGMMLYGSLRGKKVLRDRILNSISWRGDEQVLDVGCGHGLMLIGAAHRLKSGTATGVDVWSQIDQASNSAEATLQNARAEGVAERVKVQEGDARALPFPDSSFDVVLSSFAIHNIKSSAERAQAIAEIVRVLKPGGQAHILDLSASSEYRGTFTGLGMGVAQKGPFFNFVIPSWWLCADKACST